jgi:hypothetical protein
MGGWGLMFERSMRLFTGWYECIWVGVLQSVE